MGRKAKREVDSDVERVDFVRDDPVKGKTWTQASFDPAVYELATVLHGGSAEARKWIRERAEEMWASDQESRRDATARGIDFVPTSSISRALTSEIVEAATARMLQGGGAAGPAPAPKRRRSSSAVETFRGALVEVGLTDHGRLTGSVLATGEALSDLAWEDLMDLLGQATELEDRTDARLLRAYLDKRFPDWRERITRGADRWADNAAVLGLPTDADREQIRLAHRRLITRVHPDVGGTATLAARVNTAKAEMLEALDHETEEA